MAYDVKLAERFRSVLGTAPEISEKRMMGGVCFFVNGNLPGGADRPKTGPGRFMFRFGKDNEASALKRPGAARVEFGGRRMGGLVFVDEALCDKRAMNGWIRLARNFVDGLPPKT